MLVQRVFAALEEALDESLAHHGHRLRIFIIGCSKGASAQHRNAEILKIIGADAVPGSARFLAHLGSRMARHHNQFTPIVSERVIEGQSGRLHSRQTFEALFKLPVERGQFGLRIAGRRIMHCNQHTPLDLITKILVLELVETARQHGGPGHQHNR